MIDEALKDAIFSAAAGKKEGADEDADASLFQRVPLADLSDAELPPQAWFWTDYIPASACTLLAAHGGTGKSLIALMLAVAVSQGLPLFGVATAQAPVVYFSAEDDAGIVRRRLAHVLRHMGVHASALEGKLVVLDATSGGAELAAPSWITQADGSRRASFGLTVAGGALRDFVGTMPGCLLIIDNASDTFGGNENARAEVRAFVRLLTAMVRDGGGAVLLLAHIDKLAARGLGGGDLYSGSTSWNNSVRSRLAMVREKAGGLELRHEKSNYGPRKPPLTLHWPDGGLPAADVPFGPAVAAIDERNKRRAVLRLIHEFNSRGEFVSCATTSRTHAGKLLRGQSGFPARLADSALFDMLRDCERRGWLVRVAYRTATRKAAERWALTREGRQEAGVAPTAPTAPTPEDDAPGAPSTPECAHCADFGVGGTGGRARTRSGAQVGAEDAP